MASYLLNGYLPRTRALASPGRASIHIEAKRRRGELTRIRRHVATEARHQFSDGDVQSSRKGGVEPGRRARDSRLIIGHVANRYRSGASALGLFTQLLPNWKWFDEQVSGKVEAFLVHQLSPIRIPLDAVIKQDDNTGGFGMATL